MHPRTQLVVRKLSPTVSFSAYGATAMTRLISKKRRRGYPQGIISQTRDRVLATPRAALICAHVEQPGTILLVLTYIPSY